MKKLILLGMLSLSQVCLANTLYVGLGAGPDTASFDQNANIKHAKDFNVFDTQQHAAKGAFISIFAGDRVYYQKLALAGELNLNASSLEFESTNHEIIHQSFSNTTYQIHTNYGISLLPGYQLAQTVLLYGRLGFARGHFNIDTSDISLKHVNEWLSAFRYGIGLESVLNSHFHVRAEWSHLAYKTTSLFAVDGATSKLTKITPQTNQFEFALIYLFS